MIQALNFVCDSSTLANFKSWAQSISTWFSTAGWLQSSDTGQVNWTTISSVPGSAAYVYEIWEPNDGMTNFYVKVEYGNFSGTNCPTFRFTISTTTNGAGQPSGLVLGPILCNQTLFTPSSATNIYPCNYHGAAGRIAVMMWQANGTSTSGNAPGSQFFAIERSLNSSGAYTNSYVSLWTNGSSGTGPTSSFQGTLVFGVGVAPNIQSSGNVYGGWVARFQYLNTATNAFNEKLPFDTCSPCVGSFDFPCTVCGVMNAQDVTEGAVFSTSVYGTSHTYLPSKINYFNRPINAASGVLALCMRFD